MFLDRYFVVHDTENINQTDDIPKRIMPRIGIYDKINPQVGKTNPHMPDEEDIDPVNPGSVGGGLGAGWVILILVLIAGALGAVYKFFG